MTVDNGAADTAAETGAPPPEAGQPDPPDTGAAPGAEAADEAADAIWAELEAEESGEKPPDGTSVSKDAPDGAAGAAAATTEEPGKKEPGAEGEAAAGKEEPGAGDEIDWSKVDPRVKAAYDATAKKAVDAEHAFKSQQGRSNALQRRLDSVIAGKDPGSEAADDPSKTEQAEQTRQQREQAAQARTERWNELKADYPEIAEALSPILGGFQDEIAGLVKENRRLTAALNTVGEERQDARHADEEAAVMEAHPDYEELQDSDDLIEWIASRPAYVRAVAGENAEHIVDSEAVIDLLDDYKRAKGIAPRDAKGKEAGQEPGSRKPAADTLREIQLQSGTGGPDPSPGAATRETGPARPEDPDAIWAELEKDEEAKFAA